MNERLVTAWRSVLASSSTRRHDDVARRRRRSARARAGSCLNICPRSNRIFREESARCALARTPCIAIIGRGLTGNGVTQLSTYVRAFATFRVRRKLPLICDDLKVPFRRKSPTSRARHERIRNNVMMIAIGGAYQPCIPVQFCIKSVSRVIHSPATREESRSRYSTSESFIVLYPLSSWNMSLSSRA